MIDTYIFKMHNAKKRGNSIFARLDELNITQNAIISYLSYSIKQIN